MKTLIIPSVLLLQGCFFYIPGSAIDSMKDSISGEFGNNCIASSVKEGDVIKFTDGRMGKVLRISGPSRRCPEYHPVRAEVEFKT